jgi:hypothetical protein
VESLVGQFPVTRLHVQVTAAKRGEDNFRIADNTLRSVAGSLTRCAGYDCARASASPLAQDLFPMEFGRYPAPAE